MRIFRTPSLLPALFSNLIWRIPADQQADPVVYLTFDDGPVPGPTDFVLQQLINSGAQATFFCIGDNIRKHPRTYSAVVDGGHRIGNHTFNHLSGWTTDSEKYLTNTRACQRWIAPEHGKIFRPPFGRIRPAQAAQLRKEGFDVVMWDVLSYDYDAALDPDVALKALEQLTRPGSVVVFHDSFKAWKNLTFLLPRYLELLRTRGYRMEALPENLNAW